MSRRIATWSARGRMKGRIQILNRISGPQCWRVVLRVFRPAPDNPKELVWAEDTIRSAQPIDLKAMADTVIASIDDCCGQGVVHDATMDFYMEGQ